MNRPLKLTIAGLGVVAVGQANYAHAQGDTEKGDALRGAANLAATVVASSLSSTSAICICLPDGSRIDLDPQHRVWLQRRFAEIRPKTSGDMFTDVSGGSVFVDAVEGVAAEEPDFELPANHHATITLPTSSTT